MGQQGLSCTMALSQQPLSVLVIGKAVDFTISFPSFLSSFLVFFFQISISMLAAASLLPCEMWRSVLPLAGLVPNHRSMSCEAVTLRRCPAYPLAG